MIERYIAVILTKMKNRLIEFLDGDEVAVLSDVIEFYNFMYQQKLKENPKGVLNELLEAIDAMNRREDKE